ncbi:hypothetical protein [Streptomyces sp. NPDC006335]|uniref:hypothetical protein n=1 Tax=Streptomyces sp. NPDC006335 TaxID=3156895 RepID=UPI0033B02E2A
MMTLTAIVALSLAAGTAFLVDRRGEGLGPAIAAGTAVLAAVFLMLSGPEVTAGTPFRAPDSSLTVPLPQGATPDGTEATPSH